MKKINKIASVVLLSGVVLGLGSTATKAAVVGNAKSTASVDFIKKDVPLGFADTGATSISFGKVIISGNNEVYDAVYTDSKFTSVADHVEKYASPNVSVRDDRGTMPGYSVDVAMTKQLADKTNANATLKGAEIELTSTYSDTNLDVGNRVKPTTFGKVTVGEGIPAKEIFGAKVGEGAGTWNFFFGDSITSSTKPDNTVKNTSVKLYVPGGNSIAENSSYEGELTWALNDTP